MDTFSSVIDFNLNAVDAFAISLIASGVLACFFGHRLFRIVVGVSGFVAGASLAWALLTGTGYGQGVVIAGALLGAVLGAVAMFSLFYVGVFLFGCALGLLMALVVLSAVGSELNVLVACIFALVSGLVTLVFRKVLIVVSTALTGSWSVLAGISYFVDGFDLVRVLSEPNLLRSQGGWYYLIWGLWAVLGISGIGVQLRTLHKRRRRFG